MGITFAEMWKRLSENGIVGETDEEGQIIIYTGFYRHKDGNIYEKAESKTKEVISFNSKNEEDDDYMEAYFEDCVVVNAKNITVKSGTRQECNAYVANNIGWFRVVLNK